MNAPDCFSTCLMRCDLKKTSDKLGFLKENWPAFDQTSSFDSFSDKDLQCSLCLLNTIIEALANDEYWCANRDIIRLVILRMFVENTISLHQIRAEVESLENGL